MFPELSDESILGFPSVNPHWIGYQDILYSSYVFLVLLILHSSHPLLFGFVAVPLPLSICSLSQSHKIPVVNKHIITSLKSSPVVAVLISTPCIFYFEYIIIITKLIRNHHAGAPPFHLHSPWSGCKFVPEYDPLEPPTIVLKYNFISCIYLK